MLTQTLLTRFSGQLSLVLMSAFAWKAVIRHPGIGLISMSAFGQLQTVNLARSEGFERSSALNNRRSLASHTFQR
jgi:hypothetical protein